MTRSDLELFPAEKIVGVFRGFTEGGLEFHADLVLPYRSDFQSLPMHGQFLLVQLENPTEAVLGRIASFSAEGRLSSSSGEEFNIRAVHENREVPEDLREQYLRYRVNIRVLGVVRNDREDRITFAPSHRRLPHVGSRVAFLSDAVLQQIAGHDDEGAPVGHLALGEYVYGGSSKSLATTQWMQVLEPEVLTRFPLESLVSRRTFIFARAGFGKSNLNKLLFSELYRETPTVSKRGGLKVPVGTIIFDPEGEYFWPDDKGRPGLCDVPHLEDRLVVFTPRRHTSEYYQSFVAGSIRLDIRRLRPSDVVAIALSPEKQDQQNVAKLRSLGETAWRELVDLIDANGNQADLAQVKRILNLQDSQEAEALAARGNMTNIVRTLHDKSSQLMDMLVHSLSLGKLCIVDVSQLRGGQAMVLSGLILRRIFDRNQEEFTAAEPKTIPVIAVVEEAQTVLNERATAAEPYIAWVKEGRKYDLGAVLVTQQPGSIPTEILSQGDNWFIFHLLSSADLMNVHRANAHFSQDLLSVLLNEPIPGQGTFWSSVAGKPYPLPLRVLSFEKLYSSADPASSRGPAATYAVGLRDRFADLIALQPTGQKAGQPQSQPALTPSSESQESVVDAIGIVEQRAIARLSADSDTMQKLRTTGIPWGGLKQYFKDNLPTQLENLDTTAFQLVPRALDQVLGPQGTHWHTFRQGPKNTLWIVAGPAADEAK